MTDRPGGPFFDDLAVGDVVPPGPLAPPMTLTEGVAAIHQAVVGDRLPLALSAPLARAVAGGPVAHPGLVWDTAIGQSTALTRRVVANLFYRGLVFHRAPRLGDTLSTRTEVVGLRRNRSRPTGLAALRVTTSDQDGRTVLDFWRCAMLPMSAEDAVTGPDDDLSVVGHEVGSDAVARAVADWDLSVLDPAPGPATGAVEVDAGDVVSSAPELARMTLNLARTHHDRRAGDGRLVYGGHTIGLALAQASRAFPGLVTVLAWEGCDHVGPVHEGDTLVSTVTVEDGRPAPCGGRLARVHSQVRAVGPGPQESHDVLDWRFTALFA